MNNLPLPLTVLNHKLSTGEIDAHEFLSTLERIKSHRVNTSIMWETNNENKRVIKYFRDRIDRASKVAVLKLEKQYKGLKGLGATMIPFPQAGNAELPIDWILKECETVIFGHDYPQLKSHFNYPTNWDPELRKKTIARRIKSCVAGKKRKAALNK